MEMAEGESGAENVIQGEFQPEVDKIGGSKEGGAGRTLTVLTAGFSLRNCTKAFKSPFMSVATLMQEIGALPETEKAEFFAVLFREERQALLERLEEEQDLREAEAVLNDPKTEWVPWEQVKAGLHELRN